MPISKINFSTKLYTAEPLLDGSYPVVLQIAWRDDLNKPQVRRKRLGISCHKNEFDIENDCFQGSTWASVKKNNELIKSKSKAVGIYLSNFENRSWNYRKWCVFYAEEPDELTFDAFVGKVVKNLRLMRKDSTATYYSDNLKALQKFLRKESIHFNEITKATLKDFEENMLIRGKKGDRTMRGLKALLSKAVEDEIIDMKQMPFKTAYNPVGYKFTHLAKIKKKTNWIKRLSKKQVRKLLNYKPKNYGEEKALDLWKFSYFTMGVNMKDIAQFKKADIKDGLWFFDRSKTDNSSLGKPLLEECSEIIDKYFKEDNKYIFDFILKNNYDEKDKILNRRCTNVLANLRKLYIKISANLGFPGYFTFQSARFTSATISANNGGDIRAIQANMNHASVTTTEIYSLFRDEEGMRKSLEVLRVSSLAAY